MMRRLVIAAVASAMLAAAPAAQAHIQVSPAQAAPGDPVMFQLLVPNERAVKTVEVSLKIPANVVPFSYDEPAGWTRRITFAGNGAPDVVHWRGRMAADGFARFAFLASTPGRPGPLAWKAIQRYSDGKKVAWIGAPDSENPAAGDGRQGGRAAPERGRRGYAAGFVLGAIAVVVALTRSRVR